MSKYIISIMIACIISCLGLINNVNAEDVYIGTDTYMGSEWYIRTENTYSTTGNSVNCTLIDKTARGGYIFHDYVIFRSHRDMKYYYYNSGENGKNYYPVNVSSGTAFAVQWFNSHGGF